MHTRPMEFRWGVAICVISTLLGASVALAAEGRSLSDAEARYRQDRAMCESGQSQQDRATCLREAGAALAEARRGRLDDSPAQYQKNALIRCEGLPSANAGPGHDARERGGRGHLQGTRYAGNAVSIAASGSFPHQHGRHLRPRQSRRRPTPRAAQRPLKSGVRFSMKAVRPSV
jgi:hypothetical protein